MFIIRKLAHSNSQTSTSYMRRSAPKNASTGDSEAAGTADALYPAPAQNSSPDAPTTPVKFAEQVSAPTTPVKVAEKTTPASPTDIPEAKRARVDNLVCTETDAIDDAATQPVAASGEVQGDAIEDDDATQPVTGQDEVTQPTIIDE